MATGSTYSDEPLAEELKLTIGIERALKLQEISADVESVNRRVNPSSYPKEHIDKLIQYCDESDAVCEAEIRLQFSIVGNTSVGKSISLIGVGFLPTNDAKRTRSR